VLNEQAVIYHAGKFPFVRFATDVQMDVLIKAAHCINVQQFFVFEHGNGHEEH
jgi:hypothetical protein